jgi:hypothetical protein
MTTTPPAKPALFTPLTIRCEESNATTVKAMGAAGKGKGKLLTSAGALFKDLGI